MLRCATRKCCRLGVPVLGICYGMQWLTHSLGGKVARARLAANTARRPGLSPCESRHYSPASRDHLKIWNSHGDHVIEVPAGFAITGRTDNAIAAVENAAKKFYGVEFHPEVNHTDRGTEILQNFVFAICGAKKNWNRAGFIAATVDAIRKQAEGARAICALSGGVDSAVAAALVHRAIGDRLTNVFVDTGMLRANEYRETLELLRDRLGLNVIGVDASERFLGKLAGVTDPEQKRKIIGNGIYFRVRGRSSASCWQIPRACR